MEIVIRGRDLPGVEVADKFDVHVALQVGRDPVGLVRGDARQAEWTTTVTSRIDPRGRDFTGPAVHGKRGERFLYLTWGEVADGNFEMFRRAKIMLSDVPADASDTDVVMVELALTGPDGMPRCARVERDGVSWRLLRDG
jgi:hypothetical protein